MITKPLDEDVNELLGKLADARRLPEKMPPASGNVTEFTEEIRKAENYVQTLKQQAESTMAALGCVDHRTQVIRQGVADMLINWEIFKDRAEWNPSPPGEDNR